MQEKKNPKFEEVIEANKAKIFRICRVYAAGPIEAKDLFQEVVSAIWVSISSFKAQSSIDTWVYRLTLNVCMGFNRKHSSDKSLSFDAIEFEPASNPSDRESDRDQHRALDECIRSLKDQDRSIVILALDEMTYKQISEITGLSVNYVAVKMKRIRALLLKCINSKLN